jgi:hypothetical protein
MVTFPNVLRSRYKLLIHIVLKTYVYKQIYATIYVIIPAPLHCS